MNDNALRDAYKSEMALSIDAAKANGLADDADRGLHSVVRAFNPNVIIGASGQAGAFDEALVREMAGKIDRPIILPFSNPTSISKHAPKTCCAGPTDVRWSPPAARSTPCNSAIDDSKSARATTSSSSGPRPRRRRNRKHRRLGPDGDGSGERARQDRFRRRT